MSKNKSLTVTTPSDREIVITRPFDAPRRLVFEAMTRPELLPRWLIGPPGWTMTECRVDLRVGGAFRYVWRKDDGTEMAMSGEYREVTPPERIVNTERFEFGCDVQAGEQVGTAVLTEEGGRTTLTITVVYPSKEARDAMLASGMEAGMAAGYDRLDALLAEGATR
jgi:uncharacterized protein YndB with AHSA1/START domain